MYEAQRLSCSEKCLNCFCNRFTAYLQTGVSPRQGCLEMHVFKFPQLPPQIHLWVFLLRPGGMIWNHKNPCPDKKLGGKKETCSYLS